MGSTHRALIVAYLFPPVGGIGVQRPLKFTRYLGDHGWTPTVVTTEGVYSAAMDETLLLEIPADVTVVRRSDPVSRMVGKMIRSSSGTTPSAESAGQTSRSQGSTVKTVLKRALKSAKDVLLIPDESVLWARRASRDALQVVQNEGTQCVYTTSGPASTHLVGLLLKRRAAIHWVADFRDPWTDNLHFAHTGLRAWLERRMERRVFRAADAITTVTEGFRDLFCEKYPEFAHKIHVIRNGVDPNDFPNVAAQPRSAADPFTFFYAGILYPKRSPAPFLRALAAEIHRGRLNLNEIRVQFAGVFDYPGQSENHNLVKELGLESVVEILGYMPHDEVLRRMQQVDALLLIGDSSEQAGAYVPGKVYEYLFVGKPVLALLEEGEAARLIREAGAGDARSGTNLEAIGDEIVRLVDSGRTGIPLAQEQATERRLQFTRQSQAKQLAALFDALNQMRVDEQG